MKKYLFTFLAVLLFSGCARHVQYRTSLEPCAYKKSGSQCANSTFEESHGALLAFVEFDDQGRAWSDEQLSAVIDRIRHESDTSAHGILVFLFVHGWKHNASFDDPNVEMVRQTVRELQFVERSSGSNRKVIGVYAGWRGLSVNIPWIENTTFWDRKNTAHQVGHGGLTELLTRIEQVRNEAKPMSKEAARVKFLIVGHSFGGAATYSALDQILVERAVEQREAVGEHHGAGEFADLIVLVNPAFEAARYAALRNVYLREKGETNVVDLAILTSKTDLATKIAFPIGRFFSTLFNKYKDREEKREDRTAVGHYQPFITHDLNLQIKEKENQKAIKSGENALPDADLRAVAEQVKGNTDATKSQSSTGARQIRSATHHFGQAELVSRHTGDQFPVFVVAVDKKIIPDHSTINTKPFIRFLIQFLATFSKDSNAKDI